MIYVTVNTTDKQGRMDSSYRCSVIARKTWNIS